MCLFFSLLLLTFPFRLVLTKLIMICLGIALCFLWNTDLLKLWFYSFHQIWKIFSCYFFKYFFFLYFSQSPSSALLISVIHILGCLKSHSSLRPSVHFFLSFFRLHLGCLCRIRGGGVSILSILSLFSFFSLHICSLFRTHAWLRTILPPRIWSNVSHLYICHLHTHTHTPPHTHTHTHSSCLW